MCDHNKNFPKITLITPSFNQGEYLEQTILSVLEQDYPNLEYMVIDGGSSDNSVEIIKKYSDAIDYWVSEADEGQTHALVKGLARATGEWFNWINSDDLLESGALHAIADASAGVDVVAGNTLNFGFGREKLIKSHNLNAWGLLSRPLGSNTRWHQPSLWLQTEKIRQAGGLDQSLHYRFDFDLLARYIKAYPKVAYVDRTLAKFRLHGESKTVNSNKAFRNEAHVVLDKLAAREEFQEWREELVNLKESYHWHDYLHASLRVADEGRMGRAARMLKLALKKPSKRFGRKSFTFLFRVLVFGGPRSKGY